MAAYIASSVLACILWQKCGRKFFSPARCDDTTGSHPNHFLLVIHGRKRGRAAGRAGQGTAGRAGQGRGRAVEWILGPAEAGRGRGGAIRPFSIDSTLVWPSVCQGAGWEFRVSGFTT